MNSKNTATKHLRCTEDDPTMLKYAKLASLANKLGISLYFEAGECVVYDKDRDPKLPPLYLRDIEQEHAVCDFPYNFEYKMVYDNPVYYQDLAEEALRREEENKRREKVAKEKRLEEEAQKSCAG